MKLQLRQILLYIIVAAIFLTGMQIFLDLHSVHYINGLRTRHMQRTALMQQREEEYAAKKKRVITRRIIVPYDKIAASLKRAVIVAEDGDFYNHHGLDYDEISAAIAENWKRRRWAYGASTITQQLAKNLFLSTQKTLTRKISEVIYAKMLEDRIGKRRILELYLNCIEWGTGIYGIEAASRYYYNKGAAALTAEESIRLASIIINPRKYSIEDTGTLMNYRRAMIAQTMHESGLLGDVEYQQLPWVQQSSISTTNQQTNAAADTNMHAASNTAPAVSNEIIF